MTALSNPALVPPGAGTPASAPMAPVRRGVAGEGDGSFAAALAGASGAAGPLVFSKHAMARMQRRGIELDASRLDRLADGVGRAAGKGGRSSLVLVDGTAFVVAVSNRTVLTAVGVGQMKDNVFTNIDSAVIA